MDANDVFEIVVTQIKAVLPETTNRAFVKSDRLVELGANSIDRAEIVLLSLKTLGVAVPIHELAKYATLGELASAIANYR